MSTADHSTQRMRLALDEAAEWFVEFRVGDIEAGGRREFNDWLRRSPENIQAYLEIAGMWSDLPATQQGPVDVDALIARAREQGNVVPLPTSMSKDAAGTDAPGRAGAKARIQVSARVQRRRRLVLAAAAIAIVGFVVGIASGLSGTTYETRVGEQRFISLPDGSTLNLNARSSVRIRFTRAERRVDLLAGQALFRVAKDSARPFVVRSDSAAVRAVGTVFDVYRRKNGTQVTVVEGRVAVQEREPSGASQLFGRSVPELRPVLVSAGEQVDVESKVIAAPRRADTVAATAWIQHRLVFASSRLADVVDEFNRYNVRQIHVAPGPLEDLHISGVYISTDPESLLTFLRAQPHISIVEEETEIRISTK